MLEVGFQTAAAEPGLHTAVEHLAADLHPQAPIRPGGLGDAEDQMMPHFRREIL
jgi:hypothetical protein